MLATRLLTLVQHTRHKGQGTESAFSMGVTMSMMRPAHDVGDHGWQDATDSLCFAEAAATSWWS